MVCTNCLVVSCYFTDTESVLNFQFLKGIRSHDYHVILLRTMVGRGRAWLRFVLMQKKLADNFQLMMENKEKLRQASLCSCVI